MIGDREKELTTQGYRLVGVDEVGRGCIAGSVFAACSALDYTTLFSASEQDRLLVRDSKTLSHEQRIKVLPFIKQVAIESYVGISSVEEIETLGIVPATFLAMKRALSQCSQTYDILLIDGRAKIPGVLQGISSQEAIIKGDSLCYAIAAASIIAKEARDAYMKDEAQKYPSYGFEKHVGYGTQFHRDMIKMHGLCPLHRRNFSITC